MKGLRKLSLPNGDTVPVLGQGTWKMGESRGRRKDEVAALIHGIELGMTLIDTAEMYAEGGAEDVVGEAIKGRRPKVFIVSKVYPHNASRSGVTAACERSLKRLRTDRLDLYLLHWRGGVPLADTVAGFEDLVKAGKIRSFGISNFDVADMRELHRLPGGKAAAANQVLYNLKHRGIEFDLLPWSEKENLPIMAYSPLEIGQLAKSAPMRRVAERHNVSAAQIALAWVLRRPNVLTIPKSARLEHVEQNRAAADIVLTADDLADLDSAAPPPRQAGPLEMS